MKRKASILVVDDNEKNVKLLADVLGAEGYEILTANSGKSALEILATNTFDLVLLDVIMPGMDGYQVCQKIREAPETAALPIIMVTALDTTKELVKGLDVGADDFLSKPVNLQELMARVRSLLRIKELFDTVQEQAAQLEVWNRTLESRVQEQLSQMERLRRLQRFFSPQLAETIISGEKENLLLPHRREITIVFLDLRGFSSFAETAEPEEVMEVLSEYHHLMGPLITAHEATLERFTGDGLMAFFNDPIEIPDPQERAVHMTVEMQLKVKDLLAIWEKRGFNLQLGIGIAHGDATIGAIGFEGRWDYGAIGSVTNLAARLCGAAKGGQILTNQKTLSRIKDLVLTENLGNMKFKGFSKPVSVYNIKGLRTL